MSTLSEHIQTLVRRREQIQPGENDFFLWDDRQFRTDALLLCTTHLDELSNLAATQAPPAGVSDEQIDEMNRAAQDQAISTGTPPHRALARAILATLRGTEGKAT